MGCCLNRLIYTDELIPKRPPYHKDGSVVVNGEKYIVKKVVGEGAMSCVYKCKRELGGTAAVKKGSFDEYDKVRVAHAVKEANLFKEMSHSNIVKYFGHSVVEKKGRVEVCLALELCEQSLLGHMNEKFSRKTTLQENEILDIFKQVLQGVAYLHQKDPPVTHKDIKAENVLLSSDGKWKLCDFGSASTTPHQVCTTRSDINNAEIDVESFTTLAYRAPEQCDLWSKTPLTPLVDVWALGVLLYYVTFLEYPFSTQLQILNMKYAIPTGATSSPVIQKLIKSCLVGYEQRPTAAQVLEMLE